MYACLFLESYPAYTDDFDVHIFLMAMEFIYTDNVQSLAAQTLEWYEILPLFAMAHLYALDDLQG
jgi:hypothetical protein